MSSSARIDELRKKFEENPRRYFAPLANEYRKAGDVEQAIAICREYLPQQPGHMSGHIVYGQALYEGRQFEEAKTVFETAMSLDPENLIALRHLGDIALILGDTEGAKSWYGRVLEADPRNEEIQAQLKSLESAPEPAAETPVASPAVESAASSAATVVVSAMKLPDIERTVEQEAFKPRETPQPKPEIETLSSAPTAEITLDNVPRPVLPELEKFSDPWPAAAPDMAPGFEPTSATLDVPPAVEPLQLDVPVSTPANATGPIDSFTLEGLEATSMAGEPPSTTAGTPPSSPTEPAPADVPSVELLQLDVPASEPVASSPELTMLAVEEPKKEVEAPTPVESTADLPMLDLSEPAAATTASAETPPAAVTPPAETVEDVPAIVVGRAESAEPGPFVTETMAELYLSQGHRDEALRVYRALVEQRPGDEQLRAKLARMLADSGPTIRELLARFAQRRPGSGRAAEASAAPAAEARSETISTTQAERPAEANRGAEAAAVVSTGAREDRLAAFFAGARPADESERAAVVLSSAFLDAAASRNGGSADTSVPGQPARPASKDLSLDAVFGSESREAAPSNFSFDQFFSQRAAAEGTAGAGGSPAGQESRDDVAKFTQWLEGLKQR